ncbi:MAG: LacI family DNA-binding transcriptional regulator [Victivallales bacterium]|nr:LacI family DNA-binding transcriptional regulator [Victivallales bacterium]
MVPTIRDVALKAGVSFQVAAAVLGMKQYARASESTRKKIFSAASELSYVPNASARILKGNASKIIGVMIDSKAPESVFSLLAEIEHCAEQSDYRILSALAHDNPEKLLRSYRSLKQNGVDGILSLAHDYSGLNCRLDAQLKDDPKIVFVLNTPEDLSSSIYVDTINGMVAAVEHLRAKGYANPALLLVKGCSQSRLSLSRSKRIEGFLRAHPEGKVYYLEKESERLSDLAVKCGDFVREVLTSQKIDAVIAENDNIAAILMKQLLSAGFRIPEDLGVIGWDNLLIGECLPVTLTTLYYDQSEIAATALRMLLDRIEGHVTEAQVCFKCKMIVRESSNRVK